MKTRCMALIALVDVYKTLRSFDSWFYSNKKLRHRFPTIKWEEKSTCTSLACSRFPEIVGKTLHVRSSVGTICCMVTSKSNIELEWTSSKWPRRVKIEYGLMRCALLFASEITLTREKLHGLRRVSVRVCEPIKMGYKCSLDIYHAS